MQKASLFSWYGDDTADIVRLYADANETKRIFIYLRKDDGIFPTPCNLWPMTHMSRVITGRERKTL